MRVLFIMIMIFFLNGCVRPTQESYGVNITTDREAVSNCKLLGFVKASDHLLTGVLKGVAASHVDTSIRNQAGRMGADTVLMTAEHTSFWTGSAMKGEAYSCKIKD